MNLDKLTISRMLTAAVILVLRNVDLGVRGVCDRRQGACDRVIDHRAQLVRNDGGDLGQNVERRAGKVGFSVGNKPRDFLLAGLQAGLPTPSTASNYAASGRS